MALWRKVRETFLRVAQLAARLPALGLGDLGPSLYFASLPSAGRRGTMRITTQVQIAAQWLPLRYFLRHDIASLPEMFVAINVHKNHEATGTTLVRGTYSQHGVNVSERVELKINIDLVMHWRTATRMVRARPHTSGPCWWAAEIHVRCL